MPHKLFNTSKSANRETAATEPNFEPLKAQATDGLRVYLTTGMAAVFILIFGMGGWAATTDIAGAVIAPGLVAVDSNVKPIQHLTGGVVKKIEVRNGDTVSAGDTLVRLDETVLRAQMLMSAKQLDENEIRAARLIAERDELPAMKIPAGFEARRLNEPHIDDALVGEAKLFESGTVSHSQLLKQLSQRIAQLREEIKGVEGQIAAKDEEIALIEDELKDLATLQKKQLVPKTRMTSMRRQAARLRGERAQLSASAAQSRGRIAEIEINVLQRNEDRTTEIIRELREVQSRISELRERKIAAMDQLERVEIRAPQTGIVHDLSVYAAGAVIAPGAPIAMVVPADDMLIIQARVAPHQIDRVKKDATAFLLFTALNQRTTPIVEGTVKSISADLTRDERTGETYYRARIQLTEKASTELGDVKLLPGMPVDVQIRTENRTALSYLVKPFT
ncbi:MAG: HlyD family type I secretion periplasmic adaptor subunit, partial [Pseudomonadota bacterium]